VFTLNHGILPLLLLADDIHMNPGPTVLQNIHLSTSNVRSVHNKSASITDLVISRTLDILALTETWLSPHDTTSYISDIFAPNCSFYRQSGRGGGVGFLVTNKFKVKSHSIQIYSNYSFTSYFLFLNRPSGIASLVTS